MATLKPQGGGGTLIFSTYVGLGPASNVHSKNIRNFMHKIFEILATQKISPILYIDIKKLKDAKMHRNDP